MKIWWSDTWNRHFVRSIPLLVKDNLKSPLLALLQQRASPRTKGNSGDCVHWTTTGQCPRGVSCGRKTRTGDQASIQRNRKGFATFQLSTTEFLGTRKLSGINSSGQQNRPTCFASRNGSLSKRAMPVITGIHLRVLYVKRGIANVEISVQSSMRQTLEANEKKGIISVVVAKNWITPKQRRKIPSL